MYATCFDTILSHIKTPALQHNRLIDKHLAAATEG